MTQPLSSSRATPASRRRGRPSGSLSTARAAGARQVILASEPPPKKRRYVPGGPGGGGRFVEMDETDTPTTSRGTPVSRQRSATRNIGRSSVSAVLPRRPRSTRTRSFAAADTEEPQWGYAAAVAASVKQAEDYKPREERAWEEFHPHLDIEATFMIFSANEVDGIVQELPRTPVVHTPGTPLNGLRSPSRQIHPASAGTTPNASHQHETNPFDAAVSTPTRWPRRMTRDVSSSYGVRQADALGTPKTPKILPIQNQTPKERLDLKLPSYRRTTHREEFEREPTGQVRHVDQVMSQVGYQQNDSFLRPGRELLKAIDGTPDDDLSSSPPALAGESGHIRRLGRVEYDMDEQDDTWLEQYNSLRQEDKIDAISREMFEITMTKIEKAWHALEKRIPKPNPKPPQTHRPRSSSAAAVNGEPHAGEEPDSKCVICDDGDCENTNAIVFCDGCNLAVHQECYGVPFIPEGQWLCRKCQLCGRGVPTCIFCPNTDGAFKQTNSSKWAHLLCAMWIPEVSLGNHTFMEPVMDVEKVPKTRWRLSCYICHQKMGACIQCSNKNCYQAFHVTCARRAKLYLKMKTSQGALAVLDGSMVLKAFCDKHCHPEYTKDNNVRQATRAAKKFYKRNMRGRIWADNHAMANVLAARHRDAITEPSANDSRASGGQQNAAMSAGSKGQTPKNVWKLPSGAPVIPHAVFEAVETAIQDFPLEHREAYLSEACRYWTLKREARRGAALLKRLQLQMENSSTMELPRRNFAAMGPSGRARLARRLEFAENLIKDLGMLHELSNDVVAREHAKLEAAELEQDFVNECYFPLVKLLRPVLDSAMSVGGHLFGQQLTTLQRQMDQHLFVTALSFAQAFGEAISAGIAKHTAMPRSSVSGSEVELLDTSQASAAAFATRRQLGEEIIAATRPYFVLALQAESEIASKSYDALQLELDSIFEICLDVRPPDVEMGSSGGDSDTDVDMADAVDSGQTTHGRDADQEGLHHSQSRQKSIKDNGESGDGEGDSIEVAGPQQAVIHSLAVTDDSRSQTTSQLETSETPPDSNGTYAAAASRHGHTGPPTPPQSNGSLGKEQNDSLLEGGILWHMKVFEPEGTSVLAEQWAGREAIRMLSEELTDLDDDELKGLGIDVADVLERSSNGVEEEKPATNDAPRTKASKVTITKRRTSARRR